MTLTTCRRYWSCVSRYSMAANRLWYPYTMMEPRPSRSSAASIPRIPGAVESCLHWPENERTSKRVCVRLPTSADDVTLPAFAAERGAAAAGRRTAVATMLSDDIYRPPGPWQQTRCSCMRRPNDGTDRRTNTVPLHRSSRILCEQCHV